MKKYSVYALLPDLPAAAAEHLERVEANNYRLAINAALKVIQKNPKVKGRQIKSLKLTVRLIENGGDH